MRKARVFPEPVLANNKDSMELGIESAVLADD
jgi:hypothetical protein